MIKHIAIVSLSGGTLGEPSARHELELGVGRLERLGLTVRFMPHALRGADYVRDHPEDRAADLLEAFRDPEIDMILCAIGGDDTYRLLPYLFDHNELRDAVSNHNKVFLGFSDSTVNHFMLRKAGLNTFYGQSFLADVCELGGDMLPYSRGYFEELVRTGSIREVIPSDIWYEGRKSYGPDQIGVPLRSHADRGFELLQGSPVFSGEILGGCIDSMYDMFDGGRYADMPALCEKYGLFPAPEDWKGKILLLESSEEKMPPEQYRRALEYLRDAGVFGAVSGVLAGKPMDEAWAEEYRRLLAEVIADPSLPVVCNLNVGHAQPRCILPLGVPAQVDAERQRIRFGVGWEAPAGPEEDSSAPRTAILKGGELPDRRALHRALAEQLDFPEWYGNNLDALYDLLSSEREPVRVVVRGPEALEQALGGYWHSFLRVLEDLAEETGRVRVELEPTEPPRR